MKFIKKGKLFGVLNLLDIFIIVFLLAIIIPALHYYIKFNEKGFVEQKLLERYLRQVERGEAHFISKDRGSVKVDVSLKGLTEGILKKIKVGDREVLPDGTVLAEILCLGEPETDYRIIKVENIKTAREEYRRVRIDNGLYSLPAKMKLEGFTYAKIFYYKAQAALALCKLQFITDDYEADFAIEAYPYEKVK